MEKRCGHRAGRSYEGVSLTCEKPEHAAGLHAHVIVQGGVTEAVFWDGGGRVQAINRLIRGATLLPPDATEAVSRAIRRDPHPTLVPVNVDGEPCSACGGLLVRTGACATCQNCGTTTGCG